MSARKQLLVSALFGMLLAVVGPLQESDAASELRCLGCHPALC